MAKTKDGKKIVPVKLHNSAAAWWEAQDDQSGWASPLNLRISGRTKRFGRFLHEK